MPERTKLLKEIQAFLKRHQMAPSRFGRDAMGDPNFVATLSESRDVKSLTIEYLRKWIADYPKVSRRARPTGSAARASSKSKQAA